MTRGSAVRALVLLVVVFGVALAIGVDVEHCVLLAVGTLVVVVLCRLPAVDVEEWPRREDERSDTGVRREVARLSWGLHGFESRVDRRSVERLRTVAARRLHADGLDLDDPAAADRLRGVLGAQPYATLTSDAATLPRYDAFVAAVAAVERLPSSPDPTRLTVRPA